MVTPDRTRAPYPPPRSRRRLQRLATSLSLAALLAGGSAAPLPPRAQALELRGSTTFLRAPWKAELRSFNTNVGEGNVEHYLTIDLDPQAGASLGRLTLQQIRGADTGFLGRFDRARAFLGRPRHEGPAVPVMLQVTPGGNELLLDFPEPVPPGSTLTVALHTWRNPWVADTYLFTVVAWPAGTNPVAAPVGVGTLRIYSPVEWF